MLLLTPVCMLAQNRYDMVISEIMADPSPVVGLPTSEWIELKNNSTVPVNLQNWRIGDAGSQSGPLPSYVVQPDSLVIVCGSTALPALSAYGPVVAVSSFPSLDNDGDVVVLRSPAGATIHAVGYTSSWYQNELKKEGGWTLEMIDTRNACSGSSNWKASIHNSGGTPGKRNSVAATNPDTEAPRLLRAYATDTSTIVLVFDEPVDSLQATDIGIYTITGAVSVSRATPLAPLFQQVQVKLSGPMQTRVVYNVTVQSVKDCKGNLSGTGNAAKCGIAEDPGKGEWIINEILFDPRSNTGDYVELFNNSNKIIDASRLFIANRNSNGAISTIRPLYPSPYFIFPAEHMVLTENAGSLSRHYLVKNPGQVLTVSALPSFPDDEGTVVALNAQGIVTDEVHYYDDWHFKLLSDREGVALERIDPDGISQEAGNWHSAASTAGYGTPGYPNSQYKRPQIPDIVISITPPVFSPDNDGRDDVATFSYNVTAPGFVGSVTLFDAAGRVVRSLVRNQTLGITGYWNWDGLDDNGRRLPIGIYIARTEFFDLQGKIQQGKHALVLARTVR